MTDGDFTNWSEEELLRSVSLMAEELVRRHAPWLERAAHAEAKRQQRPRWAPELYEAARDALRYVAIPKYDASKGASLKTYAERVVKSRFKNEVRKLSLRNPLDDVPLDEVRLDQEQAEGAFDAYGILRDVAVAGIPDPNARVRWLVVATVKYGCTSPKLPWPEVARVIAGHEHPLSQDLTHAWPAVRKAYRLDLLDDPPDDFPRTWQAAVGAVLCRGSKGGSVVPAPPASTSPEELDAYGVRLQRWFDRIRRGLL